MLQRPIRYVYFDLDDTLLDHRHAESEALEALHADADTPFDPHTLADVRQAYREINPSIWKEYAAGDLTKVQAKVGRFTRLLSRLDLDPAGKDVSLADRYLSHYSNHWRLLPGALDAFEAIAAAYPVGIMTNGFVEMQTAKLKQFDQLATTSTSVVISEEVGVLKPHPALFQEASRRAGFAAAEILYVGDSLHSDVEGGLGAGWQVAWFSEQAHDHADVYSFTDWDDLVKLLTS